MCSKLFLNSSGGVLHKEISCIRLQATQTGSFSCWFWSFMELFDYKKNIYTISPALLLKLAIVLKFTSVPLFHPWKLTESIDIMQST